MTCSPKKSSNKPMWLISAVVAVLVCTLGYWAIKVFVDDDGPKRQRRIQTITLIKPPPPQPPKEKIPEPEVEKKEEIVEPEDQEQPPEDNKAQDEPPAGDDLGVDADGSGGADEFGLVGRKGGRSLIGGGDSALMQRYAWYTRLIQEEIRKKINDHLVRNGGLPEGDHKATVRIMLDDGGRVVNYHLFGSSGDPRIDEALKATLDSVQIGETPPEGMPRSLRLKVSSRG